MVPKVTRIWRNVNHDSAILEAEADLAEDSKIVQGDTGGKFRADCPGR